MQVIFPQDETGVNAIVATISKPRLSKYMAEAGGNVLHALALYHWNSQLSQTLYLSLQSWEVSLRNKMSDFLCYKYGSNWPFEEKIRRNLSGQDTRRLEDAIRRQTEQRVGSTPNTNQIVAELSAGFWASQLGRRYDIPYGWRNNLKWRIFVNEHQLTREDASDICNDLLDLRNRVAHHEPIFLLPLGDLKADLDFILNAMCAAKAAYMASACSFDDVWNNRPAQP